jgi:Polyketide cyclase / dehydrase and lipid transport
MTTVNLAATTRAVRWPDAHAPEGASIYVANRTLTTADPALVWAWLTRPDQWHRFYSNAKRVRHKAGPWPQLGLGSRFSWITFGAPVTTEVTEFEPGERLAWSGSGMGATAHHAWVLNATGLEWEIVTEETQRGLLPRLVRPTMMPAMRRQHQRWIDGLARLAESGQRVPAATDRTRSSARR